MLFTALVGMLIATPLTLSFSTLMAAMTGIALVSAAAAAINHVCRSQSRCADATH